MITFVKIDHFKLENEVLEYAPEECMECEFNGAIPVKYYLVKANIDNDFQFLDKEVKKQLGYDQFNQMCCHLGDLISVSRCPKCNSEEIFFDL